jgi:hypothetical protein
MSYRANIMVAQTALNETNIQMRDAQGQATRFVTRPID